MRVAHAVSARVFTHAHSSVSLMSIVYTCITVYPQCGRFEGGAFRMVQKEADATELLRAAAERVAARMVVAHPPVHGSDNLLG
jgi:hypothetical protein